MNTDTSATDTIQEEDSMENLKDMEHDDPVDIPIMIHQLQKGDFFYLRKFCKLVKMSIVSHLSINFEEEIGTVHHR